MDKVPTLADARLDGPQDQLCHVCHGLSQVDLVGAYVYFKIAEESLYE